MKRFKLPFPADIFFISAQLTVLIYIKKLKKRIVEKRMKLINKFALLKGWLGAHEGLPRKTIYKSQFKVPSQPKRFHNNQKVMNRLHKTTTH